MSWSNARCQFRDQTNCCIDDNHEDDNDGDDDDDENDDANDHVDADDDGDSNGDGGDGYVVLPEALLPQSPPRLQMCPQQLELTSAWLSQAGLMSITN